MRGHTTQLMLPHTGPCAQKMLLSSCNLVCTAAHLQRHQQALGLGLLTLC